MGYGNSSSCSGDGSWSSMSQISSNRGNSCKSWLVCEGCQNWVCEHSAQKQSFMCRRCGCGSSRLQTPVTEAQLVIARGTDGSSWDINISGPQALLFTAADQGGQLRCLSIHENSKT